MEIVADEQMDLGSSSSDYDSDHPLAPESFYDYD